MSSSLITDQLISSISMMRYWTQLFGAIGAGLGFLALGNAVGYATIALPKLTKEPNSSIRLNEDSGSWFAVILWICGFLFAPFGGALSGKLGRRKMVLIFLPFVLAGWLIIGLATNGLMLFLGRTTTAVFTAFYTSSIGVFIAETAHPSIRERLVIIPAFFLGSGMLMGWMVGYFFDWRIVAFSASIPIILTLVFLAFSHETPFWLVENGQEGLARKSLEFYRGKHCDVDDELQEMIQKRDSKREHQDSTNFIWIVKRMCSMTFLKPFAGAGLGFIMNALSGSDILLVYMVSILEETGLDLNTTLLNLAPVIVGVVRLIGSLLSFVLIKTVSPKTLFNACQVVGLLGFVTIGIFAYLHEYHTIPWYLKWTPLVSTVAVITKQAVGTIPVLNVLGNESYPTELRTLAISVTESGFLLIGAIVTKTFPDLKNGLGLPSAIGCYALMHVLSIIWGYFFIKDNRGKSLVKVEEEILEKD